MAATLSQKIGGQNTFSVHVGKQILDVVTSGMYSDPRMVIREYVQNAADSIDVACERGLYSKSKPCISIVSDGRTRTITIEDNGIGVARADIDTRLVSLGCSSKLSEKHRGFRGIGRLGGLGYCDLLKFETRSSEREGVSVIEWDGKALRQQVADIKAHENLADAVRRIVNVSTRQATPGKDPSHFFRVTLVNIHKFHSDALMNLRGLREYLSQTIPVAYDKQAFTFAEDVERYLHGFQNFKGYDITLNGTPVLRPYCSKFESRAGAVDQIEKVEFLELVSPSGVLLCRGWYAKTGFTSAFPPHVAMRGVRIRQGNIAVGDENFLRDYYSEPRFATWHIGEIHVTQALKLNARRDGFEETPEYEMFLEWVTMLCRHLGLLCRHSSHQRTQRTSSVKITEEMNSLLQMPFFLDETHLRHHLDRAGLLIEQWKKSSSSTTDACERASVESFEARLLSIHENARFLSDILDGRTFRSKTAGQVLVEICQQLLCARSGSDENRIELIQEIVAPFLKASFRS